MHANTTSEFTRASLAVTWRSFRLALTSWRKAVLMAALVFALAAPALGQQTADFNGDGFDDVATGAPGEDQGGRDAGAVNVLYGAAGGLQADGAGRDDQFWNQGRESVKDSPERFDGFGSAIATGDFNSDGFDDAAIGVPYEDIGGVTDAAGIFRTPAKRCYGSVRIIRMAKWSLSSRRGMERAIRSSLDCSSSRKRCRCKTNWRPITTKSLYCGTLRAHRCSSDTGSTQKRPKRWRTPWHSRPVASTCV